MEEVTAWHRTDLPPALQDINLRVAAGSRVGVVGRTGAGKSTLASLLLRVVEPGQGMVRRRQQGTGWQGWMQVVLDGVDTRTLGLQLLRSRVTIVPQVGGGRQ